MGCGTRHLGPLSSDSPCAEARQVAARPGAAGMSHSLPSRANGYVGKCTLCLAMQHCRELRREMGRSEMTQLFVSAMGSAGEVRPIVLCCTLSAPSAASKAARSMLCNPVVLWTSHCARMGAPPSYEGPRAPSGRPSTQFVCPAADLGTRLFAQTYCGSRSLCNGSCKQWGVQAGCASEVRTQQLTVAKPTAPAVPSPLLAVH